MVSVVSDGADCSAFNAIDTIFIFTYMLGALDDRVK